MPLPDTLYCAEQINIPPELPDILKNFAKAAIRTQPMDLLAWSAAYFNDLSKGECLPVKDRLEIDATTQKMDPSLTPGLLKTLHKQLSSRKTCSKEELQAKWKGLCLSPNQLDTLLSLGGFDSEIDWIEFFALGCSALGGTLLSSMKFAYGDVLQEHIDIFLNSLKPQVELQHGMIKPANFSHWEDVDFNSRESPNPEQK
ncbi:ropporin-1-like protein isoform X2 [Oryzias latipes]|uniref:ropporin-1-like protein isoform X2 n=1 Tax=Oryzias latipes TaxID=8090 RepID=UPI0002A48BEC|nr:ropporin-1-like protein isoform X2 [Oryzias latipes]